MDEANVWFLIWSIFPFVGTLGELREKPAAVTEPPITYRERNPAVNPAASALDDDSFAHHLLLRHTIKPCL